MAVGIGVRLQALGPLVSTSPATFHTAQINLPRVQWDAADHSQ